MSIELRISDKPFYADITFKDGTHRRIDYAKLGSDGNFFQFLANKDATGSVIFINADTIAVMEIDDTTQTVGQTQ